MNSTIVSVAPVDYGAGTSGMDARELAEEICACHDAGASLVHLHVTDQQGKPTDDTSYFRNIVERVRSSCDILIEGSTGGVGVSEEIRSIALDIPGVETGSLNMGSCNLFGRVYENPPQEIERIGSLMKQKGVIPDMCFFEPGFVNELTNLRDKGVITAPFVSSICLGFPGALPATVENLNFMIGKLPPEAVWTLVHHGARDFGMLATAIASGGNIRVGFEDSPCLTPRQRAASNHELVAKARELVLQLGRGVATPAEARQRFAVRGAAQWARP